MSKEGGGTNSVTANSNAYGQGASRQAPKAQDAYDSRVACLTWRSGGRPLRKCHLPYSEGTFKENVHYFMLG